MLACDVTCGRRDRLSSCALKGPDSRVGQPKPYKASLCQSVITITGPKGAGGQHMIPLTVILTQIATDPGTDLELF